MINMLQERPKIANSKLNLFLDTKIRLPNLQLIGSNMENTIVFQHHKEHQ